MFNNINNKSWFNNKVLFIISLAIMFFSSIVSAFAVSSYLYNSNEVSFNNASSTSISSSNVQGAIDELYADAHNYSEMNTRVSTLEDYFTLSGFPQGRYLVLNKGSDSDTSVRLMQSNKVRGLVGLYSSSSGTTAGQMLISAFDASQSQGKGVLNLEGNPVKVNGTALSDYFKVVWYNDNKSRTLSAHSGLNANDWTPPAQTGYTFDCVLAGYGNGDVGLMVSPNKWIYNASTATKTYSYVTWLLLYKKS